MGKSSPDRLYFAGVLAICRGQRHTARYQYARQVVHGRQGDHHRRQSLVAGSHPENALPGRQRTYETAKYGGGVVAVREAVHHTGSTLRPSITGIGAKGSEGDVAETGKLLCRRLHEQAYLPMTRVIAESHGRAIFCTDAALGAQYQKLLGAQLVRSPPHTRILAKGEDVAAGSFDQHLGCQRQAARRSGCRGLNVIQIRITGRNDGIERRYTRLCHQITLRFGVCNQAF